MSSRATWSPPARSLLGDEGIVCFAPISSSAQIVVDSQIRPIYRMIGRQLEGATEHLSRRIEPVASVSEVVDRLLEL